MSYDINNDGFWEAHESSVIKQRTNKQLVDRITEYLSSGGLFNPELSDHNAVRELLIDCRDALNDC